MGLFLQLLVRGLITGSVYALLGASWGIIYNTTRTFHFAHGFVYTLGAYMILLGVSLSVPLVPAMLLGIGIAAGAGAAIEAALYSPMRNKGASQLSLFITAMGIMIAGQSLIHLSFGPDSRPLEAIEEQVISMGPVTITSIDVICLVTVWAVLGGLFAFLSRSRLGMMIRAVASNPEKATFIGIDAHRVFRLVFAIGSLLVGVAALLGILENPATPSMGLHALLISFITVFLGGVGSLRGAVIGGLILGVAESLVILVLPTQYKMVVTFLILFTVILFKPEGLMGAKSN